MTLWSPWMLMGTSQLEVRRLRFWRILSSTKLVMQLTLRLYYDRDRGSRFLQSSKRSQILFSMKHLSLVFKRLSKVLNSPRLQTQLWVNFSKIKLHNQWIRGTLCGESVKIMFRKLLTQAIIKMTNLWYPRSL
jgi:hypothetical protein